MSYIFSYIPFIFGRTSNPVSIEKAPGQKRSSTLDDQKRRATVNASVDTAKPLHEREIAAGDNFLGRMLTVLKHGSRLERAALDCKKFLASVSRPGFDLGTAVPLLGAIKELDNPNFKKLFENTINYTIEKFAEEAKKSGLAAEALTTTRTNISDLFDSARKSNYKDPFDIAEQYKNALIAINEDQPVNTCWRITIKSSGGSKK